MDNTSRVYREIYINAKDLAKQGRRDECLDICWTLRLQPDLSLYRRAHVNLLIASIVDVRDHPTAAKYAQEAIDLIEEVKGQGFATNLAYLDYLHGESVKVKKRIDDRLMKIKEGGSETEQKTLPLELSALGEEVVRKLREDHGESSLGEMTLEERQPLFIEGMYTGKYASIEGISDPMPPPATVVSDMENVEARTKELEIGSDKDTIISGNKFASPAQTKENAAVQGTPLDEGYVSAFTTPMDATGRNDNNGKS